MIEVRQNQSMFDLALMAGGTIECAFELAKENDLSLTGKVIPGTVLSTDQVVTIDSEIQEYYETRKVVPASIVSAEIFKGIGYMIIGKDFIVK